MEALADAPAFRVFAGFFESLCSRNFLFGFGNRLALVRNALLDLVPLLLQDRYFFLAVLAAGDLLIEGVALSLQLLFFVGRDAFQLDPLLRQLRRDALA